jgi:hypothetical protein
MQRDLHPVEKTLASALEDGRHPSVIFLGGLKAIGDASASLARSPLMPELLRAVVEDWQEHLGVGDLRREKILSALLENARADFVLMEAVDVLDGLRPLPGRGDEICFATFLRNAQHPPKDLNALARSACLDGALRWSMANRRWQLRLLDCLLGLRSEDDAEFLRHAARIVGVAYAHWPEDGLLEKLREIAGIDVAEAEASFELGLANVTLGLDSPERDSGLSLFGEAKKWFERTTELSDGAGARLYIECLELLEAFRAAVDLPQLKHSCARIQQAVFEFSAYQGGGNRPSWIGARDQEALSWSSLAGTLAAVAENLAEPSWWEPAVVVEDHILAAYTASRTILRRNSDGSLDSLIRPRIKATLARREGQAYQLKAWLRRNPAHVNAPDALQLIAEVDKLFEGGISSNPTEAVVGASPVAALIDKAQFPEETKRVLMAVAQNTLALQIDTLTAAESSVIESCRKVAGAHPDHQSNVHGQRLYDAILLWTVRFVANRLEVTQKDDSTVAYLFERADGSFAHEDELHADYFRWLATAASSADLEPTNIGGGRADVRLRASNERIVVEVKREMSNASFDALATWYAGQTTDYQNISIRLGFLVVLDLTTENREGTPHLTSLFQTRGIQRQGEDVQRVVTIVRIPGRRKRPSDLTKAAKSRKPT